MTERLPARLEVAAIMRRVEAEGGFATVLHRGDPDRGEITLIVSERGQTGAVLERRMAADFSYRWAQVAGQPGEESASPGWLRKKSQIDPDCWLVELDVADAQRFIAETIAPP